MTEIHRCPQGGIYTQGKDPAISQVPQSLRFVDHHRETHLNNNSTFRNQLDLDMLNPLELVSDHQHTQVQNLDIPECHSNQQPQPQPRVVHNILHRPVLIHKNLVRSVQYHTILNIRFSMTKNHFYIYSIIGPKTPNLHFRHPRKHHAPQIYQVELVSSCIHPTSFLLINVFP